MAWISFIAGIFVGFGIYFAIKYTLETIEWNKKQAYETGYIKGSIETEHRIKGGKL